MLGNWLKTSILMAGIIALFGAIGMMLGGKQGMLLALVFGGAMNIFAYWNSDKMALAMNGAREVSEVEAPDLHGLIGTLAARAGLPKPRVYVVENDTPNAFATGRNPENAVVAVTEGIMRLLSPEELRGVVAHEIGHIVNRDILIQTIAGVMGSAIVTLANIFQFTAIFGGGNRDEEGGGVNPIAAIAMALLAPMAAGLIQMAISRSREYLADDTGAELCGQPLALAGALNKLGMASGQIPMQEGNPSTEQMFIVTPMFAHGGMASLFSTHPPLEERIQRLREMASSRR